MIRPVLASIPITLPERSIFDYPTARAHWRRELVVMRPHRSRIERSRGKLGTMEIVAKARRQSMLDLGWCLRVGTRAAGTRSLCIAIASTCGPGLGNIPGHDH